MPIAQNKGSTALTTTSSPGPVVSTSESFEYVPILSMYHADKIADKVIACCERNGFNPIAVFVLDASGSPLISKRMDGCSPVGISDFARAKAYSCIVNKYPSRTFRDRYTSEEASAKFCQMTSMVAVSGNQMAPFPGGILLKIGDTIVGAVGVSGAAGDEDEYCAIRGVQEANLGLSTVPEYHVLHNVIDGEIDENPFIKKPQKPAKIDNEASLLPARKDHLVMLIPQWTSKQRGPW